MKIKCNCPCKGQDNLHGKDVRIGNKTAHKDGNVYRCTGCGKEHRVAKEG